MEHLWLKATQFEAEGLQQIECTALGSGAEALYDIIWGSLTDSNLSMSIGPPLAKRQRQAAMVTVASLTVQEPKAVTPKPREVCLCPRQRSQWR